MIYVVTYSRKVKKGDLQMTKTMTVKEFIKTIWFDIDVYDDYDERCGVAYCPTMELTEKGKRKFRSIMNNEVRLYEDDCAVVHCETEKEAELVRYLFHGYAGLIISSEEWDELFIENWG